MQKIKPEGSKELKLAGLISKHEGFKLNPYKLKYKKKDGTVTQEDFFTGGVGHRMSEEDIKEFDWNWSDDQKRDYWNKKFIEDLGEAQGQVEGIVSEYGINLTPEINSVLTSMAFQMGERGLRGFPTMLTDLADGRVEDAITEMMYTNKKKEKHSAWYNQTQSRVDELIEILRGSDGSH